MAVACLVFPTVAAAGDCTPSLGDPAFVPTGGTSPTHIVVADFNGDGESDLAVCNSTVFGGGVASLAILLGNGTGAFGAPMTMSTTGQPHFIAAGDFNGDGILDLAVTLKLDLVVSIYRGLGAGGVGNGTFAQPVTYPTGGQPFQIVTGDYNEDGILDLAVAINNIPRVSVLRGLGAGGVGNGAFAAPVAYPLANLGRGIAQGDFNNDGILDLVATEWQSGTVGVLRGQGVGGVGNGTFAPTVHFGAGVEPVDLEVFDYNKDGILDLAVANGASAGTVVLRGQGAGGIGTGSFAIQATLPTGNTSCVIVIDVNEDGLADLLSGEAVAPVGRQLHLFLGNGAGPIGNGTWSFDTTVPLSDEPYQLAVTDLDGDGHEDALASGYQTDRLTTLFWSCRIPPPVPPDLRAPVLTRVRDVPADEGGRVYLTWLPSSLDVSGGAVTSYRIWRQIPDEAAQAPASGARTTTTRTESTPTGEVTVTFWEAIATLPAQRLEGYGYTAPTTEDSTAANPVSTAFFVSALTADPNVFYSSDVASGASIDNLAPQAPANFRTESAPAGSLVLAWSRNTEPDLERYHLYRSATAAFAEGETTLLDVESDTTYTDAATSGPAFYRVAAVDEHGNESAYSPTISTGGTVGVGGGPVVLALAGARPNPATAHEATLLFSLASEAPATLELYDVRGRRVAAPSLEGLGAGHHSIRIDRHVALAPGVYVVRLTQGGRAIERKIAITP